MNVKHAGTEMEGPASPSQPGPDDERPPEPRGEHRDRVSGSPGSELRRKVAASTESGSLRHTAATHLE